MQNKDSLLSQQVGSPLCSICRFTFTWRWQKQLLPYFLEYNAQFPGADFWKKAYVVHEEMWYLPGREMGQSFTACQLLHDNALPLHGKGVRFCTVTSTCRGVRGTHAELQQSRRCEEPPTPYHPMGACWSVLPLGLILLGSLGKRCMDLLLARLPQGQFTLRDFVVVKGEK